MNQKLDSDDNHPPSGFFLKIKKFFKNPFFIKTQSVSEVTEFLKDDGRVADYRLGTWGEGDTGVTIVTLR